MKSYELVSRTIKGEGPARTPIYAWVRAHLTDVISESFGSVENFEDYYEFDLHHIFGGPNPFDTYREHFPDNPIELTPDMLLDIELPRPDRMEDYTDILKELNFFRKERSRFCYIQTPGFFEGFNDIFGIENHLLYLALYPDELKELYLKLAAWNKIFAANCLELGADMIHISDDWGAQNNLMFSPATFAELIEPCHRLVVAHVHSLGGLASLHSDGCITQVLHKIPEIGFDVIHPFQESAGMSYDLYLDKYSDKFGIMGGLCVQTTLGFGDKVNLKKEIERIFGLLRNKRWICCTSHYVQNHCTLDELIYALDLIRDLRDGKPVRNYL